LQRQIRSYIEYHSLAERLEAISLRQEFSMTSPLEQKIKITGPVVVTANRVGDGAVVYRSAEGGWTTALAAAAVATKAADAQEMVRAAVADDLRAVGPYIAPVKLTGGGEVLPGNLRERIRLRGPTIDLPTVAALASVVPQKDHAQIN
jgi:hypothetical protein